MSESREFKNQKEETPIPKVSRERYLLLWPGTYLALLIIFLGSCTKSGLDFDDREKSNTPLFYSDSMIVGDIFANQIIGGVLNIYYPPFDLDIDQDNVMDFRLSTDDLGSRTYGSDDAVRILCLHENAQILVESFEDTIFAHSYRDTTYRNDSTWYRIVDLQTCHRGIENTEPTFVFQNSLMKPMQIGSVLYRSDDHWATDTIRLNGSRSGLHGEDEYGSVTYQLDINFINDCYAIDIGAEYYAPFKIKNGPMGWLRIRQPNEYSIDLLQYAVQIPLD